MVFDDGMVNTVIIIIVVIVILMMTMGVLLPLSSSTKWVRFVNSTRFTYTYDNRGNSLKLDDKKLNQSKKSQ